MRLVFFDSDVLLDVLMERQPFVRASASALTWATLPGNEGMVAGHAITNMFYILRRKVGREEALRLISAIAQIFRVASITESVITRNSTDFTKSLVPTLSPDDFLAEMEISP